MRTSTETITDKTGIIEKDHGIRVDDWCGVIQRAEYIVQKSFNGESVRLHNVDTLANPLPTTASLSSVGVKN
jgi:hypothetical protein